jgi:hypothetical protein
MSFLDESPDLDLDLRICRKIGKRPGQTLRARCEEILKNQRVVGSGISIGQVWIARVLTDPTLGAWESMRRADAIPITDPGPERGSR